MSIARLRKKLRQRGLRMVFWGAMLFVFILSCFLGYGSYMGRDERPTEFAPNLIAKVDRQKITRDEYNDQVRARLEMYERWGNVSFANYTSHKKGVLDGMVDRILKLRAAKKERIKVGSRDVDDAVENRLDQQIESLKTQAGSARRFALLVKKRHESLSKLKREIRAELNNNRDAIAEEVRFQKLEEKIKDQVHVTLSDYRKSKEEIRARHILIKTEAVRDEDEGKDGKATEVEKDAAKEKRRKAAEAKAKKKAEALLRRLKKGEDFAELAKESSEDYTNRDKGGDLGFFTRGKMAKPFEEAAFKLKKGELSDVVKTEFGYHLIKLEDRRPGLPDDYNDTKYKCKNKDCEHEWSAKKKPKECPECKGKKIEPGKKRREELLEQFADQKKWDHWREYQDGLKDAAKIEVLDPELRAYELQLEGETDKALAKYKEALEYVGGDEWIRPGPIHYSLAQLYERKNETEEAIGEYRKALESEEDIDSHMALARLFKRKSDEATAAGLTAADLADAESFVAKLAKAEDPVSEYLSGKLSAKTRTQLEEHDASKPPSKSLRSALLKDLNKALEEESIYDKDRFSAVKVAAETRARAEEELEGKELLALNRTLLQAAYSDELAAGPRAKAIEELKLASELCYDEVWRRNEIMRMFTELGATALAEKEQSLIAEQQPEGVGAGGFPPITVQ